jgi:hypothetical protein
MAGKIDKVKALNDQGYLGKIVITWSNERLRGDKWKEELEVGRVDAKCIAMVIDSAEVLVQEEFERRANSYDFDAKQLKGDKEASERKASQLARKVTRKLGEPSRRLRFDFGETRDLILALLLLVTNL